MKYCNVCGGALERRIPAGDNLKRDICSDCGHIHYVNPRIVTGCIPVEGERILLCKRAIEPRYGYWTLPAGFLELGETSAEGGVRETLEEARASVEIGPLFSLINVTHIGQVHMFYRAEMAGSSYAAGDESLEVDLFTEEEIPWDELAFPTVRMTLEDYFADRRRGEFGMHTHDITRPAVFKRG